MSDKKSLEEIVKELDLCLCYLTPSDVQSTVSENIARLKEIVNEHN